MADAKQILIASPDAASRRSLADQLVGHGFTVGEIGSGEELVRRIETMTADAVILDADIADIPLTSLCQSLRERDPSLPIVVLGGDEAPIPAPSGSGLSGHISKPFRLTVLVGQLSSLLKARPGETAITPDGLLFDAARRVIVDAEGLRISLTEKEVAILSYMRKTRGRVVSREELLAEVWGYAGGATTHTVETHIYRLRRKLGERAALLLATQAGGYRLDQPGDPDRSPSQSSSTSTGT